MPLITSEHRYIAYLGGYLQLLGGFPATVGKYLRLVLAGYLRAPRPSSDLHL